jgi:hypothetical protein
MKVSLTTSSIWGPLIGRIEKSQCDGGSTKCAFCRSGRGQRTRSAREGA